MRKKITLTIILLLILTIGFSSFGCGKSGPKHDYTAVAEKPRPALRMGTFYITSVLAERVLLKTAISTKKSRPKNLKSPQEDTFSINK